MVPKESRDAPTCRSLDLQLAPKAPVIYIAQPTGDRCNTDIAACHDTLSGIARLLQYQVSVLDVHVLKGILDSQRRDPTNVRHCPALRNPVPGEQAVFTGDCRRRIGAEVVINRMRVVIARFLHRVSALALRPDQFD